MLSSGHQLLWIPLDIQHLGLVKAGSHLVKLELLFQMTGLDYYSLGMLHFINVVVVFIVELPLVEATLSSVRKIVLI